MTYTANLINNRFDLLENHSLFKQEPIHTLSKIVIDSNGVLAELNNSYIIRISEADFEQAMDLLFSRQ
jgi:hypothetical protein